ncbi:hypothetical protein IS481_01745 [Caldimonas thermodepolymerans]|jgi:LPS-assembly lipoprotein|uniref:LPS-assembly lipoprotein LptE n=1 Tax=Caldimonas thermodepolymerans TaxID=215580 RepID=A0A2S5T443_9BURK|nr:LPS assembly lipoprotein LptE [Caldimonas thermodepolymerans]PPE69657.1 hypothetical protein C1702_10695 [Caldimonas thermodepolymerans]QPC31934.1 hypothetical protein IS481_01745 [Caldimonas thermodepolymerans]RDI01547.1 LPS-assembly lipoprotein [Caldimonas thermodepolymerans]TCP05005.1 LPS-assembly lipoprotein [Caldimonas thermodepolymerans]UZG44722.1 LPS assembly lipoprotein LptE [Caldimonas thermodepolymerans]
MPTRRTLLLGTLPALLLAGCGFRLRGDYRFAFQTIKLGFAQRSEIGDELRRQLAAAPDVRVVESAKDAQVVLEVLEDRVSRSASASTAAGQVREITLRTRLRFRLLTAAGRELIPETELVLSQLLSYNETDALGKESEEAELVRDMRRDIVAQVMRRLAAVEL